MLDSPPNKEKTTTTRKQNNLVFILIAYHLDASMILQNPVLLYVIYFKISDCTAKKATSIAEAAFIFKELELPHLSMPPTQTGLPGIQCGSGLLFSSIPDITS